MFQEARARNSLCPDLKLQIPTDDGVCDQLAEIKMMSACVSRYVPARSQISCFIQNWSKTLAQICAAEFGPPETQVK